MLNFRSPNLLSLVAAVFVGLLAACGGGGDSSLAGPPPEGLYGGTLTGTHQSTFRLLVLENGEFWALIDSDGFGANGLLEGSASFANGVIAASNVRDYRLSEPANGSGTYGSVDGTLALTIKTSASTFTFNGSPVAAAEYDYQTPASLSDAAGIWSLRGGGYSVRMEVSPAGSISGATGIGCRFTGTLGARRSGKNVFDVSLVFALEDQPCFFAIGQPVSGIALIFPSTTGPRHLIMAVRNAERTRGLVAVGGPE